MTGAPQYVVITPVRNEAEHIGKTVASMAAQTVLPRQWVVVDDGSTDGTAELLDSAAREHPWIRVVRRADRGFRHSGNGVMEAFYEGFAALGVEQWDFLVKLDGDLSFEPDFFEKCFKQFRQDSRLGIGGGTICCLTDGQWVEETRDVAFHVRGATKIYRRECWTAIGGLIRTTGWDTMDEVKANMLGWTTRGFPDLKVLHYRPTGGADGRWKNWFKNGRANYIVGYHPIFMLVKCARRALKRPVAGVGLLAGFLTGPFARVRQIEDRAVIRYLRRQQMNR